MRLSFTTTMALAALVANSDLRAQATGVIVIAHGGDSVWNAGVRETVRSLPDDVEVELAFLMGPEAPRARFHDAVNRLVSRGVGEVVVVPLLVSSHSGHFEQIRYLARLTDSLDATMLHHLHGSGIERAPTGVPIRVARALDDSPELARALADRARALVSNPTGRALMLVGHGPNSAEDYAAWMRNLRPVADSVRRLTGFRDVRVELVREDAPAAVRAEAVLRLRELISMQHDLTGHPVAVVPILISRGGISRSRVLDDLAGLPVEYDGSPLVPQAEIVSWILGRVSETSR